MTRKYISLRVKLAVALRQLGLDPKHVRLDHHPPLEQRRSKMVWGEKIYDPVENDPRYMQFLSTKAHKEKTTGRRGTSKLSKRGGDLSEIAKTKRLERDRILREAQADNALVLPAKTYRTLKADYEKLKLKGKHKWPKRKLRSRPFSPKKKLERS